MRIGRYNIPKQQVLFAIILLIGLVIAVVLVQYQQHYRSRANDAVGNATRVTNNQGYDLQKRDSETFETDSLEVEIEFDVYRLNGE